ncbi:MAG: orotate phosphoribosyltransferase [Nitrospiraceae bacterium]|nr:MAG: orotate phosphoribosyltransferase [Nitrospiraceae bacterium]
MAMENLKESLIQLIRERSFQYSNEPKFKLSSGAVSSFYFNMKKTTQSPDGMYLVGKIVFEKIKELGLHPNAIGGLTMGADPIAYAVTMHSYIVKEPINAFVIRKEPKQHGLKLPIEGDIKAGEHVIIVDDVVTTGGSTITAINIAKENGLIIDAVIILVDRCEQNGRQNIQALGYPVYNILTLNDFIPAHN